MNVNIDHLNTLSEVAKLNTHYPRARLAAAIVRGNKIVSVGINQKKTDPLQVKYSKNRDSIYLHAEIHAIKNALRKLDIDDLQNTDLYVCRVKRPDHDHKAFQWGMSKPCDGCLRAIAAFNIRNVVYTTDSFECKYEVM